MKEKAYANAVRLSSNENDAQRLYDKAFQPRPHL